MKLILALIFPLLLVVSSWYTPWSRPRAEITVTGEAKQQLNNQVAHFNVTVSQTNKDKQTAVEAVNREMDKIIKAVKDFGIEAKDLTTQNVSVYEIEKQWQANNSLEIILREVGQASALTDLLQGFFQAQVSGPSFSLDETANNDTDLLIQAVQAAREKAEKVAAASGRRLGKVLTVDEGFSGPYPLYREMAVSDKTAAPVEPGSSQTSKTVTVVFELR